MNRRDERSPRAQDNGGDADALSEGRMTPLRELQLLEAHRQGDPDAIGELLRSYQRRIYSVCYRMLGRPEDAADLTQDALVKVFEGLDSYNGKSKLSTWVIRIAMNCCLSHLRREKVRKHGSLEDVASTWGDQGEPVKLGNLLPSEEPTTEQRVEQVELQSCLLKAFNGLDPESRALLMLRDLNGLDYIQIGEVLDIPVGTVKSRLFRARSALRVALALEMDRGLGSRSGTMRGRTGAGQIRGPE